MVLHLCQQSPPRCALEETQWAEPCGPRSAKAPAIVNVANTIFDLLLGKNLKFSSERCCKNAKHNEVNRLGKCNGHEMKDTLLLVDAIRAASNICDSFSLLL